MGLLEPITHSNEIKELLDSAQSMYDTARKEFEAQKSKTAKCLDKLGNIKLNSWANEMRSFSEVYKAFGNAAPNGQVDINARFAGSNEVPAKILFDIQKASTNAKEAMLTGAAAAGTAAVVGVAAYGGAAMFGKASTGTAIADLSGAAQKNATLAWFGGGAKASGGLGISGGKIMLAGLMALPALGVASLITNAKGKRKLEEAKQVHAESKKASGDLKKMTAEMNRIAEMSDDYSAFIKKFNKRFKSIIGMLEQIKEEHDDGAILAESLSLSEQKAINLSWEMAQIYYKILETPILDFQGNVSGESAATLKFAKTMLKQFRKETYRMTGEDALISNVFWKSEANKMIAVNFAVMAILLLVGIIMLINTLKGALIILCAAIVFPLFFKYRDMSASKLYRWRLARLLVGTILALIVMAL